jgi:serine protease
MQISSLIRRAVACSAAGAALALVAGTGAAQAARTPAYVPGEIVVGYRTEPAAGLAADVARRAGARSAAQAGPTAEVLHLPRGASLAAALRRLRHTRGVAYAEPNFIAHESGGWYPDDRGRGPSSGDWTLLQWNFMPGAGVDAPLAWSNLMRDGAAGGRGVTVAILDTGVAFKNWTDPRTHARFDRSPDFAGTRFSNACDLVSGSIVGRVHGQIVSSSRCTAVNAVDRQGHGTFVAGVIAEATNNRLGLTGLAYGATIMPIRVLDAQGNGDSSTIAEGIRYAVTHGAQIVNLSLEFDPTGPNAVTSGDIPDVIDAIAFAHAHGVMVVAASGNDALTNQLAYPAADQPDVVSVGATTRDGCLADYSNSGPGLDLVAPGGGDDAAGVSGLACRPGQNLPRGDIYQMTFPDPDAPDRFGLPGGWYGTSMSAPHVAATAALIIASGVLGARPSPDAVLGRMEQTAQQIGQGPWPNEVYGYGLLDAGAATSGTSQTARAHQRPRPRTTGTGARVPRSS